MEQFTEHLLNTSRKLRTPKRTRKMPWKLGVRKERKKEKRNPKKGSRGVLKVKGGPHTQKTPQMVEMSAGTERDLSGIQGGHHRGWSVEGRAR